MLILLMVFFKKAFFLRNIININKIQILIMYQNIIIIIIM
jgi:hypothetical protein